MRRRLHIPILVDNEANLGALAEAAFGAARNASDLIYLKVSSGIGAGLVLNGRLSG
jgi:predicted NBD/HSP70 family sugar kinase